MKRPGGFDGARDGSASDGGVFNGDAIVGDAIDPAVQDRPAPAVRKPVVRLRAWRRDGGEKPASADESAPADEPVSADEPAPGQGPPLPNAALEQATVPLGDLAVPEPEAPEDPVRVAERELKSARRSVRSREKQEQRRFTRHLRRRRRQWLIAGGAVLALALFVAIGVLSPLTAVREVRLVGASQVNVEDIQTALSRFEGVPLALVQEGDVHRALEPFPLIQRYSIERIPPHTLVVRIEERDAVIAVEADGGFDLLDPAGVLVATAAERPLGVPLGGSAAANPSTPAFEAAGKVIRDLPQDIRELLASVSATSAQDVTFTLTTGTEVIWGEAVETQRKAIVLRSMLAAVGAVSLIDVSAPGAPVFQ